MILSLSLSLSLCVCVFAYDICEKKEYLKEREKRTKKKRSGIMMKMIIGDDFEKMLCICVHNYDVINNDNCININQK